MPNDKIIQFNNTLYFGNQLSQIPDIAQLNDTLLYHSKKVVPVTNLDIQNVYTINMGVLPDGYNTYIGTISSYFIGDCLSLADGTSSRVPSKSISYQLQGFSQTGMSPSSNTYPPFSLDIGISYTIYPDYSTSNEYNIYDGTFTSLTYNESLSELPKEYIVKMAYRYDKSLIITGSFVTEFHFLMYKIA